MTCINKWNSLLAERFEWVDLAAIHPFVGQTQNNADPSENSVSTTDTLNSLIENLGHIVVAEIHKLQSENIHYQTYVTDTPIANVIREIIGSVEEIIHDAKFTKRLNAEIEREFIVRALAGPQPQMMLDTQAYMDFLRNGVIPLHFSKKDNNELKELLSDDIDEVRESHGDWQGVGTYDREKRYTPDNNPALHDLVNRIYRNTGAFQIATAYMGCELVLAGITLQVCRSTDQHWKMTCNDQPTKKLEILHFDPKQGMIKSIHYLNDVTLSDGPFKYIPTSHRWQDDPLRRMAAKTNGVTNYLNDETERARFLRLPKALQHCAIIGSVLPDGSPLAERLLKREYPYTTEEADAVLFDPGGLHRGGIVDGDGERVNLQIMFRAAINGQPF